MDNIQLILYIVFVVGYLIFKAITGGKRKPPHDAESPMEQHDAPQKKKHRTPSFEDILKELTGVDTQQLPETIDKPRRKAKEKAEEISEKVTESYQKATEEAEKAKKLDERINLGMQTDKIKVEELADPLEEPAPNNYASWMQDADDAKKAFILSEIINKKYF